MSIPNDGKITHAPCGHVGEHVIGNFIRCLEGCDGEADVMFDQTKEHVWIRRSGFGPWGGYYSCEHCGAVQGGSLGDEPCRGPLGE